MEAPRGVERTGTNGRTHERPSPGSGEAPLGAPAGGSHRGSRAIEEPSEARARSRPCPVPEPREPHPARIAGCHNRKSCGGHGPGETPSPIPNLEAKARHGDGTAPGRVWESSTPPHQHLHGGSRGSATRQPPGPPSHTHTKQRANRISAPAHTGHTHGAHPAYTRSSHRYPCARCMHLFCVRGTSFEKEQHGILFRAETLPFNQQNHVSAASDGLAGC